MKFGSKLLVAAILIILPSLKIGAVWPRLLHNTIKVVMLTWSEFFSNWFVWTRKINLLILYEMLE